MKDPSTHVPAGTRASRPRGEVAEFWQEDAEPGREGNISDSLLR